MRRSWQTFNPGKIVPTPVTRAIDEFDEDIVRPYAELISSLKQILELAKLALLAETDPVLALLDIAIQVVQELLEVLLTPFGFHMLFVPVLRTNNDVPELDFRVPINPLNIVRGFDERATTIGFDDDAILTEPPVSEGAGGNWGFYTVFANSLVDDGDLNRPDYPDTFAMLSWTIITGASNVGEILKNLFHLMKLLQEFVQVPLDGNLLPVPQDLKLVTIAPQIFDEEASANDDDNNVYAILRWDTPPPISYNDFFLTDVDVEIISTSVYMKRGSKFRNTDVGDTLADLEILNLENAFLQTRVAIGDLDPDEEYYFAVGYNVEVTVFTEDEEGELQSTVTPIEHYDVSNQIRILLNERTSPASNLGGGEFPDWVSATAPLSAIPGVEDGVRTLLAMLQTLRDQIASPIEEIEEFLEDMEEFAEFWLQRLLEISETLQALSAALKALRVGFSIYGFYVDEGGTNALTREMNRAFFDASVENRPPFEGGGDVVAGIVWVGGAPGPAALRPLLELYRLLFGDVFQKIEGGNIVEDPLPPDTGLSGEETGGSLDLSEALDTIMRVTEEVERSTEDLVEATGLVPEGETSDVDVEEVEVESPCD